MRLIHRYLVRELALNALFSFLVLTSVISMLTLSVVALKTSTASLSVTALLEVVALLGATQLNVILPLTVLIATVWTYGRAQADGEITAMRGAGIHLYQLITPAIALGAVVMFLLAYFQDEVIPAGHYRQLVIGKRQLADSIEAIFEDSHNTIEDRRFKCTWAESDVDAEGFRVLRDVVVAEIKDDGEPPLITRADLAEPRLSPNHVLSLTLRGLRYGERLASDSMTISLDLEAVSEEPPPRRKSSNWSYEELITTIARNVDEKEVRQCQAELHKRIAVAVSALLFALFGAPLGLVLRISNRAYVFGIGFVLVLALNYAPMLLGESLARNGTIPAFIGLWAGDVLIVTIAVLFLRKATQR